MKQSLLFKKLKIPIETAPIGLFFPTL